jgi:Caspase domain
MTTDLEKEISASRFNEAESNPIIVKRVARVASLPLSDTGDEQSSSGHGFTRIPLPSRLEDISPKRSSQCLWDQTMSEELNLPPGYLQVSVLLIQWDEEIADPRLNAREETARLKALFKDKFRFKTSDLILKTSETQDQVQNKMIEICEAADDSSLLIIYYNGHGTHMTQEKVLRLHP